MKEKIALQCPNCDQVFRREVRFDRRFITTCPNCKYVCSIDNIKHDNKEPEGEDHD
jgi:ssDNA-binding Zn-finger/Zn-ribbon topoisomerase 1